MTDLQHYDVLVVGLGPGGASAAATAAEAGLRVLGVDKNVRLGEPVQCAEFIPNPMGGYARNGVKVQPITAMKSFLPSGCVETTADFKGIMIDRARFDQAIAERAMAAGAELRTATTCRGLEAGAREALIRHQDGIETEIGFDVLVAADGPHSTVAAQLGLDALRVVYTRQYTVPLYEAGYGATDIWLSDDYPGGYGWLFPKGEVANLGMGADKRFARFLKEPLDRLHTRLVEEGRVGSEVLARTGGAIPVSGLRERLTSGSTVFVGDAAGLTHPITGAGIAAAVVSGERAGRAAAEWLGGDPEAFDDYEEDVRDQYEVSINRALERRAELDEHWRTPRAHEDGTLRRGWIAFDEYFAA